jgi:hypothetical protein
MANTNSRYTYVDFANEVIAALTGELEVTADVAKRICEKADALRISHENKAAYNKANPKKSTAKGASADTQAKADAIAGVLSATPMTASDINEALGTDFTALQVANATKFIPGVTSQKVIRDTVNGKGLRAQKEYTAYTI